MTNFDEGESFAEGDDDEATTTYTFDIDELRQDLRERLIGLYPNPGDSFEPRQFAERLVAQLSATRSGTITVDRRDAHLRIQVVLNDLGDDFLRAKVAHEALTLLSQGGD